MKKAWGIFLFGVGVAGVAHYWGVDGQTFMKTICLMDLAIGSLFFVELT